MTTTVTIKTHDWPVEVSMIPLLNRKPVRLRSTKQIVEANSEGSFIMHNGQSLAMQELPSAAELAAAQRKGTDRVRRA